MLLWVNGSAVAFEYAQSAALGPAATAELASGISAAFLAGAAGIVLGILALLGIHADILTPVRGRGARPRPFAWNLHAQRELMNRSLC